MLHEPAKTLSPTEAEIYLQRRAEATKRLTDAQAEVNRTVCLPPGNPIRDEAVRKLHWAIAVMREWGMAAA